MRGKIFTGIFLTVMILSTLSLVCTTMIVTKGASIDGSVFVAHSDDGEYNHPYYSLRRIWKLFDKIAPSLELSAWVENGLTREYLFSIKPDGQVSLQDVFSLFRDHYEGTEFDLTKGVGADPFGNPN